MTQYGAWVTNKPVPFQRHRFSQLTDKQEGVVDQGDYKVSAHAGNLSVDIAIGKAWIQIDTGTRNGLAFAFSDAIDNLVHAASDPSLPRLDQIVLQYNDTTIPAGVGGDVPTTRIIQGTPTAGTTLDNRNGAAALPADCVRLADVLIPAAATTTSAGNIRDRRPWARGARYTKQGLAGDFTYATAGAWSRFDTIIAPFRLELSGAPLDIDLFIQFYNTGAGGYSQFTYGVDGTRTGQVLSLPNLGNWLLEGHSIIGNPAPAVGSHEFSFWWYVSVITGHIQGASTFMRVREDVRQDTSNT